MSAPETLRDALLHDYYASDDVRSTVGYSLGDRLDAIIAAARAESDALRAALEWMWRHAGQSHEIRSFVWWASPGELGYLICRRCPAGDDVFQVTPNPAALAPSPSEGEPR